ncbi:MAG TPA: ADP-forming succinate--CoA ligase subunit beta [Alphaproteobacteria bacterium]|nr:ADP-forming succinate--CoA ligase subunit beta [Rhodospirillaceae bacterium]HRJ12372.1 ADP-forming succinate--CoA ligase subunit beta [Alphaproteobacteria bacterium]
MNIHEYQGKELLRGYGVQTLKGQVAYTPDEAEKAAAALPGPVYVVKSQIHAGGRGKGKFKDDSSGKGGVRVVKSLAEVKEAAAAMLGKTLVTIQTGPEGKQVGRVYIEDGCDIKRELYLGALLDRATSRITFMASTEGGMDIEEVAHDSPEKIIKVAIDPAAGFSGFHARKLAYALQLEGDQIKHFTKFMTGLYKAITELDIASVEINPLVVTGAGEIIALDAKVSFDENALYRHPQVMELRDETEEDPQELEASRHSLNYVRLDGNIGCMVNGAGLAMATMDIIKLYGGEPANFLDVGGGATKERVTEAFKLILSDKNVEGIFVNIFGGIMRCDVIADGVISAAREVALNVPLVVRLEGTNVELGKKMLNESGLPIVTGDNLADGAEKIVKAVKEAA